MLQYDFGKHELDENFVLKGTLNKPRILLGVDGSLHENEIIDESPLPAILDNIPEYRGYTRPNSGDILVGLRFTMLPNYPEPKIYSL